MSSITAPDASTRTRTRTRSQLAASIGLWAAQVLLGLAFASGGWLKLSGDPAMAGLFDTIGAGTIGAGQWLRFFVGAVEIAGGLGLLIPALSGLAARGLITLLAGAAITNVALGVAPVVPAVHLVVAGLIAWARPAPLPGPLGRGRATAR